ncbi:hypothetical protein [Acinetobacter pittii]|uniref:hypothetical protein n=1 Tax=Acinetobacter pittii TaxID=48296 RepID=UPI0024DEDB37|nr:hypothetical protein [Acinetobacter pittii]
MLSLKFDHYSLEHVLSDEIKQIIDLSLGTTYKRKTYYFSDLLAIFIEIKYKKPIKDFNFKPLNNENLENHYKSFICFIYKELDTSIRVKYLYSFLAYKFFSKLAELKKLELSKVKVSNDSISSDVQDLIKSYLAYDPNERLLFYSGWPIRSSDQEIIYLNLANCYTLYGEEFTRKIHNAMINIGLRKNKVTLERDVGNLTLLLNRLTLAFKNLEELMYYMNSQNAFETMYRILNICILEIQQKRLSHQSFLKRWSAVVCLYNDLIEEKIFPPTYYPILAPVFKKSNLRDYTHLKNEAEEVFTDKLITRVPISYSTKEAKEKIFEEIVKDIQHVVSCCEQHIKQIMDIYKNFNEFADKGRIKKPEETVVLRGRGSKNPTSVGLNNIENVCATYREYPFTYPNVSHYQSFLGLIRKTKLIRNYIPEIDFKTIYPFLILLIYEHPAITEAWLTEWKLYENGVRTGYEEINGQWCITSYKSRKGYKNARQTIILNEKSKYIVECLIKITKIGREHLKQNDDKNYEYMLLTSSSVFTPPSRSKKIPNPTTKPNGEYYKEIFIKNSYDQENNLIRNEIQAKNILDNLSLTRFRASNAVKIYIETASIYAMSTALGHEYCQPRLIKKYLPQPLWNYFSNRWIRIFQNAIVYEAMKTSEHLYKAVDFTPEELDLFLKNHSLESIPQFLEKGKIRPYSKNNIDKENTIGVFPLSVGLLLWLIAIINFFDKKENIVELNTIISKWHQSAHFIISQLEFALKNRNQALYIDDDVLAIYQEAKKSPLPERTVFKAIEGVK